MGDIFNMLLQTNKDQSENESSSVRLAKAEEDELADENCRWSPSYVMRATLGDENEETRLIGHVEFLGGKPGALTEAYKLWKTNKWGSLRCVLGLSLFPTFFVWPV